MPGKSKAISAVISVVLLLLISIGIVATTYTWLTATTSGITKSGTEKIEKTVEIISSCMKIQSIGWNKVYIVNCGKGVITNDSLAVFIDGVKVEHDMNPSQIKEDETAEVTLYGLWRFSLGEHKLKITSGKAVAEKYVRFKPHPSAVLVFTFDRDTIDGNTVKDLSGKGNDGTIYGAQLVQGKFGEALRFDGVDDYVKAPAPVQWSGNVPFTVAFWI